ncbi:MAG: RDD family protein [Bdellovibrionaceae bacterium]|nr:RDD family protein [Pseudobdellovibrionaceae bacterium]
MQEKVSEEQVLEEVLAGFWRRLIADVIDKFALAGIGLGLSFIIEDWIIRLGTMSLLVGLLILIIYYLFGQSRFANGQTLGKRVMRIQVLDLSGQFLSLSSSLSRCLLQSTGLFFGLYSGLVSAFAPTSIEEIAVVLVDSLLVCIATSCWLPVLLHPLKRGLHDYVANSVVVRQDKYNSSVLQSKYESKRAKRAVLFTGIVAIIDVVLIASIWFYMDKTMVIDAGKRNEIENALKSTGKFQSLFVAESFRAGGPPDSRHVTLEIVPTGPLPQSMDDLKPLFVLADETARRALGDFQSKHSIEIHFLAGYDMGIYRSNRRFRLK